jgi:hypothetical protein
MNFAGLLSDGDKGASGQPRAGGRKSRLLSSFQMLRATQEHKDKDGHLV